KIVTVNPVNTGVVGTYFVTYNVKDTAGNAATQVARIVNVVAPPPITDTTPPLITLLGSNPVTVQQGSTYTDAGAIATDNIDGTITSKIVTVNPVNTGVVGTYFVTYNVKDTAGNAAIQVARLVNVVAPPPIDTTPPTVSASPVGGTFTITQSVTLAASEPATIYYTKDGTTPTTS